MSRYVLGFEEIDETQVALVGGKGANLGELSVEGIRVPAGFCVTTDAFRRVMEEARRSAGGSIGCPACAGRSGGDRRAQRGAPSDHRSAPYPRDLEAGITGLANLGEHDAYAVRSSATAEDLPRASFAGQQDTYLNVTGRRRSFRASADAGRRSSPTGGAYRLQTASTTARSGWRWSYSRWSSRSRRHPVHGRPVTGNRKVASEASFGLGEALVSGLVNADRYKVRDGGSSRGRSAKRLRSSPRRPGVPRTGDRARAAAPPALTDAQVLRLVSSAGKSKHTSGPPRTSNGAWSTATSRSSKRPITTLYPIPRRAPERTGSTFPSVTNR